MSRHVHLRESGHACPSVRRIRADPAGEWCEDRGSRRPENRTAWRPSQIHSYPDEILARETRELLAICLIWEKSGLVWKRSQSVSIARGQDLGIQEIKKYKKDYRLGYLSRIALWVIFRFSFYRSQEPPWLPPGKLHSWLKETSLHVCSATVGGPECTVQDAAGYFGNDGKPFGIEYLWV